MTKHNPSAIAISTGIPLILCVLILSTTNKFFSGHEKKVLEPVSKLYSTYKTTMTGSIIGLTLAFIDITLFR